MSWTLVKELFLKQLHFIIASILAIVFATCWVATNNKFKNYKIAVLEESGKTKDSIIEKQTEVNNLTERLIEKHTTLENDYAETLNAINNNIISTRKLVSGLSTQSQEIRTNVVSSADTAYATKVATTYIDLYSEIKQHAVESSEQADRATAEAFKQYESCKLMVDEYNKFKDDSNEKKD